MNRYLELIEQVIEEHKTILERLDQVVNDAEALRSLERAQQALVPGRFDQKTGLDKLSELVDLVEEGLRAHFDREETALLAAFEEHGDQDIVSSFRSVLLEHKDLRDRLAHTKRHVSELSSGDLSAYRWNQSAHDMHAHISHTRKLLQAHAEVEQELLHSLRRKMLGEEEEQLPTESE